MKEQIINSKKPSHVVGIGASAGCLEALQSLFDELPPNLGLAYVVVQHLSPDFKSMMDGLIGKNTSMPVHQTVEDEEVLRDNVYVIPSGKLIRIAEGRIYLSDLPPDKRINLPINEFFRSLADDMKHNAIGIILSGTGSDGSRGIQAIKEVGGMVMVQDPNEAEFDGMPISAINTGAVDFVLRTTEMPHRLMRYISHPLHSSIERKFRTHLFENSEILEKILTLINQKTELDFKAYKESTVSRRIENRMGINNKTTLQEYYEYIKNNDEEVELIKQSLLIGVTQFFRDTEVWEDVRTKIIEPLVLNSKPDEMLRVWTTGCSTGEEAYTIAIIFAATMQKLNIQRQVKVFASDIDQSAVAFAANGLYPPSIAAEVPQNFLNKYFMQLSDGSFQVDKRLRSMVVFATHNLIQDPPFSNMHLISCRNTLIYLQSPAQQKIFAFLHFSLRLNGYLVLGSAETPGSFSSYFEAIDVRLKIYKKTKDIRIPVVSMTHSSLKQRGYHPQAIPQILARNSKLIAHQKDRIIGNQALVETFVPPTLIFNNKLQIVYSHGDTTVFTAKIKPGQITNDIADILEPSIVSQAISAAHQVVRQKKSVLMKNIYQTKEGKKRIFWSLKAFAFHEKDTVDEFIAISFIKDTSDAPIQAEIKYNPGQEAKQRIEELDEALLESQKLYREALEELDSVSEELQSSNEELMAANEELQSTNEELQSVNEELYTVNSEYQEKISELTHVNNDLENLIKSTKMAVVFLDQNLKIRRYTEAFRDFVNIIDFDIDREFKDLSLKENYPGLHEHIEDVNHTGKSKNIDYKMNDKTIVYVTLTPYISAKSNQGVIMSMRKKDKNGD